MRQWRFGAAAILFGSTLMLSCPFIVSQAEAASSKHASNGSHAGKSSSRSKVANKSSSVRKTSSKHTVTSSRSRGHSSRRVASRSRGISCVPYARSVSGITLAGNAWQWWDHAAGTYARGKLPEANSVLAFRSNSRMRMGHVAVVSQVINAREVLIDHANWPTSGGRGGIARNIAVVDVSEANDWSAVRVQLGRSGEFGSVYPTYGFIYDRPDNGVILTAVSRPAPHPELNPPPRDLRPVAERSWRVYEEVAEAPQQPSTYAGASAASGWTTTTQFSDGDR